MSHEVLQIGDARLDCDTQTLHLRGRSVHLSAKVRDVLQLLAAHAGEVLARDLIVNEVWKGNHYVGQRGLTNVIWQLRRHLGPGAVTTFAKTGYRLELAVEAANVPHGRAFPLRRMILRVTAGLAVAMPAIFAAFFGFAKITESTSSFTTHSLTYFNGMEEFPAYSRSGTQLAFTWEKHDLGARIMIRDIENAGKPLRQVSLTMDDEVSPAWGPGDARLAFARVAKDRRCTIVIRTLSNLDESVIDDCAYERYHRILEWSADGRYLFYAGSAVMNGAVAIIRHDLRTGETRRVTQPGAGDEDNQLAAAPSGHRLAFVRSAGATADVFVLEENGTVRRITRNNEPVFGIAWLDDEHLLINAFRNGEFSLWKLSVADGESTLYYKAETPFNIAVRRDGSGHVAFSLHRGTEFLELLGGRTGNVKASLTSTGRDMYGDYSPANERLVFLSSRSGRIEVWTSRPDGSLPRVLADIAGLPEVPRWSPNGRRIALPVFEDSGENGIVLLTPKSGERHWITHDNAGYRNLEWIDDHSLVVSSDRGGEWNLWRVRVSEGTWTQLTTDGGRFGQVHDGYLYYTRPSDGGVWRRRLEGGLATQVIDDLSREDWGGWGIGGNTLYYIVRQADADEIWRQPLPNGEARLVESFPRNSIRIYRGLAVAENGDLVVTRLGNREADIIELRPADKISR